MNERIKKIMEYIGVKPSEFAETIGIQRAAISHYMSGRNEPSLDVIKRIHDKYPEITLEWLLYGSGEMLDGSKSKQQIRQLEIFDHNQESTPEAKPSNTRENRPVGRPHREYRKEIIVETNEKHAIATEKQSFATPIIASKKVSKIMLFYTDNTFETFIPER
jgi:transcriptional regulator with XRE-family HTH domain